MKLKKIESFEYEAGVGTIVCYKGSTAEAYAIENGINYRYFSDEEPENPDSSDDDDENDELYHPTTPSKPRIDCDDTSVESYKNAFLGGDWNTFKITGEVTNYTEYYNLEDIWITIKSPDENIIKFDSNEKNEVTFPLGRSIGTQKSSDFKCKAYVNRDYMPTGGTETLTLTCILNGELNGEQVEGVYTTFNVKVTNLSYKKDKPKPNKTVRELLEQMRDLVDDFERDKGYYIPTGLDYSIMAVKSAIGFGNVDAGLDLANMAYDLTFYLAGITNPASQEFGKLFLEQLSANTESEVDKIIDYTIQSLKNHHRFNEFVEWCCKEYGIDVGEYEKFRNNCPTDIVVTDEFGDVVLEIIDDEIRVCNSDVFAYVHESKKTFYLPTGIDHEIKIIATDDGTMDYIVETTGENGVRRTLNYKDVPLSKGKSYTAIAPSDISEDTSVYNLKSEDGTIIKHGCLKHSTIIISSGMAPTCTLSGYAQLLKCTLCGEKIKIGEIAAMGHQFDEPWLTELSATCVSPGIGIFECSKCGYFETKTIPATGHTFDGSECINCDYDKADNCDCRCHKDNFFAKLIWKIINFFNKFLRRNQECDCGLAHY